jgi:hypothetical protein
MGSYRFVKKAFGKLWGSNDDVLYVPIRRKRTTVADPDAELKADYACAIIMRERFGDSPERREVIRRYESKFPPKKIKRKAQ